MVVIFLLRSFRLADNLPAATVFRNLKTGALQYEDGFKLGFVHDGRIVLNNHLTIIIKYHPIPRSVPSLPPLPPSLIFSSYPGASRTDGISYRIVGFEVDSRSISVDSLQLSTDKKAAAVHDKQVEAGAKCLFPKEVEVAELRKGSEFCMHV